MDHSYRSVRSCLTVDTRLSRTSIRVGISRGQLSLRLNSRLGFTLVELLVVIAIIGVLVALLLPAIQAAREAARKVHCSNNLRQMGVGLQNYLSAAKMFPAGQQQFQVKGYTWSWSATTLDYFEESGLRQTIDFLSTPLSPKNRTAVSTIIPLYLCPSVSQFDRHRTPEGVIDDVNKNGRWDPGEGMALTDYAGIAGPHTSGINQMTGRSYKANQGILLSIAPLIVEGTIQILRAPQIRPRQISDGMSNTIVIGEVTGRAWEQERNLPNGAWAYGTSVISIQFESKRLDPKTGLPAAWSDPHNQLYSDHPGGVSVLCCDGSVHFMDEKVEVSVLQALASRADGEPLPDGVLD
jgi:prepilin-type N-terminal cleavage/methylation domain-containing protein